MVSKQELEVRPSRTENGNSCHWQRASMKWVDSGRILESMKEEFKLQDPFEIMALEQLMNFGKAKLHFESLRAQYK